MSKVQTTKDDVYNCAVILNAVERMESLHLHFYGPFSLCSEAADVLADCSHRNEAGIYLWAVRQSDGRYRISYIGETNASFYRRTKEHIIQVLGGNYRITDCSQMLTGNQEILWNGLWRRGTREQLPQFLSRYEELAPLIKRYLFAQAIFVGPLSASPRVRKRVEGALAHHVRSIPEASSLFPADIRFVVRRPDELPMSVTLSADRLPDGLPVELKV